MIDTFLNAKSVEYADLRSGMSTTDNTRFLRMWHEIDIRKSFLNCNNLIVAKNSLQKWFPYNKGGDFRKWYSNQLLLLNWYNDGEEIKYAVTHNPKDPKTTSWSRRIFATDRFFNNSISWSKVSSNHVAFRYFQQGFIFDVAGTSLFPYDKSKMYAMLALMNSHYSQYCLDLISPTINYEVGHVSSIPINDNIFHLKSIDTMVAQNISISKLDWDFHETSWDFQANELVTLAATYRDTHPEMETYTPRYQGDFNLLEHCYNQYVQYWTDLFHQLHTNEETLNKQFIEIYGLQDELTPDVPLSEVTILQQGEITIENDQLVFHGDVVMKQFISYLVGLCMGRYRLDNSGLHIAHPKPTEEETAPYTYRGVEIPIAPEPILPLLPDDAPFQDNLQHRIVKLCAAIFGPNQRDFALQFIQEQLGRSLEDYLNKDFWKDHKKMYKNRPIYWLFTSDKGHFRCLTYMHRMNEFTAFKIFKQYLGPYIGHMRNYMAQVESKNAPMTAHEHKTCQLYQRYIKDCEKYIFRLQAVAEDSDRTRFDLDDGFVHNYAKYGDVVAKV